MHMVATASLCLALATSPSPAFAVPRVVAQAEPPRARPAPPPPPPSVRPLPAPARPAASRSQVEAVAPERAIVVETVRGADRRTYRFSLPGELHRCSRLTIEDSKQRVGLNACNVGGQRGTLDFELYIGRQRTGTVTGLIMVLMDDMPFDLAQASTVELPVEGGAITLLVRADEPTGSSAAVERQDERVVQARP